MVLRGGGASVSKNWARVKWDLAAEQKVCVWLGHQQHKEKETIDRHVDNFRWVNFVCTINSQLVEVFLLLVVCLTKVNRICWAPPMFDFHKCMKCCIDTIAGFYGHTFAFDGKKNKCCV